jgi:ATP-dependent Clp protease adaptor protein ClpS
MKPPEHDDQNDDGDVAVERESKVGRARLWCVVFWNDDFTTKWFVVHVLEHFFRMNETTANNFMMAVHRTGKGIAGLYTRDVAESKAEQVMQYAREFGMPLMVTAEPDEAPDGDET